MNADAFVLFGAPVVAGAAVGYLCGGRLSGLLSVRLRRIWLLWLAAVLQCAQFSTSAWARYGEVARVPLLVATFAAALAWLTVNTPRRPRLMQLSAWTAVVGGIANAAAIAVNGRMPYSRSAAAAAGLRPGTETAKNVAAGTHTHLLVLGDIIPVAAVHAVVSIGDLLIVAGVIGLITSAMHHVVAPKENPACTPGPSESSPAATSPAPGSI